MDKMKFETPNLTAENVAKIAQIFPGVVTEGKVNFELLRTMLGDEVYGDEAYEFTWVGKRDAIAEAGRSIRKTLRPVVEDETIPTGADSTGEPYCSSGSKNWDTTENLYIEGDNLDVLKLLQESYLGKVKMIYIDPPYNTGNDFIYRDDFKQNRDEYEDEAGVYDEDGDRLFCNTETNGRFHSDWCSMMYPRLVLARNMLRDDGAIFISIGKTENHNLIKCCDEIYGEQNKVGIISRIIKSGSAQGQYFSPNTEYILVYAKNITELKEFKQPLSEEIIKKLYTSVETEGERKGEKYRPFGLYQSSLDPLRGCSNQRYYIEAPDGTLLLPPGNSMPEEDADGAMVVPKSSDDKVWRWSKDRYLQEKMKGNIVFKKSKGVLIDSKRNSANWNVYTKIWLNDRQDEGMTPVDLIVKWENRLSKKELQTLNIPFDFAKPSELIKYLISLVDKTNDAIILDFFSGSATTAHAVMQLNAEDGGNRKFIMVQLPEVTDEKSEAYKAGYKNICEIGKERIRRAGEKIKAELEMRNADEEMRNAECGMRNEKSADNNSELRIPNSELDIGFRVLKLDDTNMNDVYYAPDNYTQELLLKTEDNIKSDRTDMDLLYGCLLDWGLPLSMPHTHEKIDGFTVHTYNDGDLIACFEKNISEKAIREIASRKPLRAVFRDEGFISSPQKINVFEIFKLLAPNTSVKVI